MYLIESETIKDAGEKLDKFLESMLVDYSVKSIALSPIVDIFPFDGNDVDKLAKFMKDNDVTVKVSRPSMEEKEPA